MNWLVSVCFFSLAELRTAQLCHSANSQRGFSYSSGCSGNGEAALLEQEYLNCICSCGWEVYSGQDVQKSDIPGVLRCPQIRYNDLFYGNSLVGGGGSCLLNPFLFDA